MFPGKYTKGFLPIRSQVLETDQGVGDIPSVTLIHSKEDS